VVGGKGVRVKTQYEKISVLVVHDVLLEDPWREEIGTGGAQVETRNDDVTDRPHLLTSSKAPSRFSTSSNVRCLANVVCSSLTLNFH
jgi:hypothetical protein